LSDHDTRDVSVKYPSTGNLSITIAFLMSKVHNKCMALHDASSDAIELEVAGSPGDVFERGFHGGLADLDKPLV
jgi:hypothetical protein